MSLRVSPWIYLLNVSERPLIFRPLSIDDIVSESITLLLRKLPQILAIALLANVPVILWQLLSLTQANEWIAPPRFQTVSEVSVLSSFANFVASGRSDMRLLAAITIGGLSGMLQAAAITWYAARLAHEEPVSIGEAVQQATRRFGDIVVATIIPAVLVAALSKLTDTNLWGTALFIVLVVLIYPRTLFAIPAIMLDGHNGLSALWHSLQLSWTRFGRVLSLWVLMEFVLAIAFLVPTLLIGLSSVNLVLGNTQRIVNFTIGDVAIFLMEPVRNIALMLLYFDLRRRHERKRVSMANLAQAQ